MYRLTMMVVAALLLTFSMAAFAQETTLQGGPPQIGPAPTMGAHARPMPDREWQEEHERAMRIAPWEHRPHPVFAILLGACLIVHVLLTVWVYQDMRQRNAGSGLWIPIVLLSGFFGTLLYAVARLSDIRQPST